ncbi:hypothetical protein J2W25_006494 [Variovorax boronicumulans]|uniref:Antitoxin Xre/MbcA/ParS-like toxin-binding domain-containing protein n=1 Tax=Variovorax boronicumulans TaxID=436515 RepID=A0AAW8E783_9BURK|nr:hypothetical protein [Variovorax boronicumulans]MDP9882231.1 hypothetical protein [Variovorax boronicumulans]MDP9927440.1 hypothetical protein [Variovorax boronicumulans]
MTFPQISSSLATSNARVANEPATNVYAPASQTTALLQSGAQFRRERIEAADMISTDDAAGVAGTTRVTINAWIKAGRCIGVSNLRRGFRLPSWQFEPSIWPAIKNISANLNTNDGWRLLAFLETPREALDGRTPRAALEQGAAIERILALATAEAH